ncbi:hypothetical protein Y032_0006g2940 [Ancylostoma ceylanicum]|uniref:Uncharacterized protein n=1 Tax=Ancylostoma ceylanicum TaxID=53326 RepID=A0A016VPM0_9BILA|nr:hypothetical protein Y032_0006g2940 [Ancylostoma ceylanicum]
MFIMHGRFSTYTRHPSNISTCKARQRHSAMFAHPTLTRQFSEKNKIPWLNTNEPYEWNYTKLELFGM